MVLSCASAPLDPFVSWDLEFFFAVTCLTTFDSERCSELDRTELVAPVVEVDCDETFSDAFTDVDLFSVDEFTLEDWDADSSITELLVFVEEATTLDFALAWLVKLLETSLVSEDSRFETATEDFLEFKVLEVETRELFFTAELEVAVDRAANDTLDVVEVETPFATDVDKLADAEELETKTEFLFTAALESVVETFLAEKDLALAIDFTILFVSADDSVTIFDSCPLFSLSSHVVSPVFNMLDFLSNENSSPDTFFIRLLTVSCIRFDMQFASVLVVIDLL